MRSSFTEAEESRGIDQIIAETESISGAGAKLLLWPENAVRVEGKIDNARLFDRVSYLARTRRAVIAATYAAPSITNKRKYSTAVSAFGADGTAVFTYLKQALVPYAETYVYEAGRDPLPRNVSVTVPHLRSQNRHDDAVIQLSAAICHDTSFPHILRQAYPASLTMVPSSVFDARLAWTRIRQLQIMARSLNSAYMVCDGADEGISAFVDQRGQVRSWQKGPGSFQVNAGFSRRGHTLYGVIGDSGAIGLLLAMVLTNPSRASPASYRREAERVRSTGLADQSESSTRHVCV